MRGRSCRQTDSTLISLNVDVLDLKYVCTLSVCLNVIQHQQIKLARWSSFETKSSEQIIRWTPPSRPSKVGLKCPSLRSSVRPQKVSSISMKFGM